MRVDSHHHLWHYTAAEFGWIPDSMASLRRDFLLDALDRELDLARVDGTVVVQARQTLEETDWLLDLAGHSRILGVVGWAPIADPGFPEILEQLCSNDLLKGLRHIVQAEPDGFLDRNDFSRGVAQLQGTGLVYDLLVYARQLPMTIPFVDRHPSQPFVLDHMGKPDILHNGFADWARDLRELALRPHVACKISGLVTEADPLTWTAEQFSPYLDIALEAFGPERLMIGTDWPVCTVGVPYAGWWALVERWAASLSPGERDGLLGDNAVRVYRLKPNSMQNAVSEVRA